MKQPAKIISIRIDHALWARADVLAQRRLKKSRHAVLREAIELGLDEVEARAVETAVDILKERCGAGEGTSE